MNKTDKLIQNFIDSFNDIIDEDKRISDIDEIKEMIQQSDDIVEIIKNKAFNCLCIDLSIIIIKNAETFNQKHANIIGKELTSHFKDNVIFIKNYLNDFLGTQINKLNYCVKHFDADDLESKTRDELIAMLRKK